MKSFLVPFAWLVVFRVPRTGASWETLDCKDITSNTPVMELKRYLFCNYDSEVRPTKDSRNATVVRYGLSVIHFEVDELANTLEMLVWTRLQWTDPHLTWNPSEFGDVSTIHVMSYEIWVPDITLHSATTQNIDVNMPITQCVLSHEGRVLCVPVMVYKTHCDSDHTWWPYDMMNCSVHVSPWSYSNNEIDVHLWDDDLSVQDTADLNKHHLQWRVMEILVSNRTIQSKFLLNFTSSIISYHILLQRYSAMYIGIYTTEAIVLMTMTLMTLWLEPNSTERMIIANLNFVLHLIALQDLCWVIPFNGSRSPKLLRLYESSLIMAAFSLILTSILRHLQQLNTDAPAWVSSGTVLILKSRVGQILLMSTLDPKVSAKMQLLNADDNTNLVSPNKTDSTWRYISILIGWLALFSIFLVYVIMLGVFLPTSTSPSHFAHKE